MHPRIFALTEANRNIDVVAAEVGERVRREQFEVDFRMLLDEAADARRHEARRERRQHRHHEPPVAVSGAQLARGLGECDERRADFGGVLTAAIGEAHALAVAGEQRHGQLGLERPNLVADGAMRDEEFVGGARKAFVARGGFEGAQCVEGRELAEVHGKSTVC